MDKTDKIPFTQFLQEELEYMSEHEYPVKEGIVGVKFTINYDGSLSNVHIENSVSKTVDQAVLHAVENSNNKWFTLECDEKRNDFYDTLDLFRIDKSDVNKQNMLSKRSIYKLFAKS